MSRPNLINIVVLTIEQQAALEVLVVKLLLTNTIKSDIAAIMVHDHKFDQSSAEGFVRETIKKYPNVM